MSKDEEENVRNNVKYVMEKLSAKPVGNLQKLIAESSLNRSTISRALKGRGCPSVQTRLALKECSNIEDPAEFGNLSASKFAEKYGNVVFSSSVSARAVNRRLEFHCTARGRDGHLECYWKNRGLACTRFR